MTERMRQLEVVMDYDCRRLMEVIIEGGTLIECDNLISDYKEKKAEFEKLRAEFEKEFLVR